MPFCSNCGNKIENESKFCSNCGAKVASSDMDSAISNNLNETGTVIVHRGNKLLEFELNDDSPNSIRKYK